MPLSKVASELQAIDTAMSRIEPGGGSLLADLSATQIPSATNLLQYLVLRRFDLRHTQRVLAQHGLSSLGRCESHVRDGLTAVRHALHRLCGIEWTAPQGVMLTLEDGEALLERHTEALFGPRPTGRAVRVMVTMPTEAADDYRLVRDLVAAGMDCMRVNCAHDGPAEWARMIAHLRRATAETGRYCSVSIDLAGPKLRTAGIVPGPAVQKIKPRRDPLGQLSAPAVVAIVAASGAHREAPGADVTLLVEQAPPAAAGPGSLLTFVDARGRSRVIHLKARHEDLLIGTLDRTAYVVPGTELRLQGAAGLDVLRLAETPVSEQALLLRSGERIVLTSEQVGGHPASRDSRDQVIVPAHIGVTLPQIFEDVQPGERIWFDDGRIGGVIRQVESGRAVVEITQARPDGDKLMAGKGINLPDTNLRLESLTEKDIEDLRFIVGHADLVGYSFVRRASDVERLQEYSASPRWRAPRRHSQDRNQTGVRRTAAPAARRDAQRSLRRDDRARRSGGGVRLRTDGGDSGRDSVDRRSGARAGHLGHPGARIAREDRCPFRAEVTDAAMSERAECVMLNKGPFIREAVRTLDDILRRMEAHQSKKRSMLRPLNVAQSILAEVLGARAD